MSSELKPYWHRLLMHYEKRGYIRNGLTIPFLIGSLEIINPSTKLWTISDMTESLSSIGCTILKCSDINEFVIGSLDVETMKNKIHYHCPCKNLVITDGSLDQVGSCFEISNLFNQFYQVRVERKEYSKNSNAWTFFSQLDIDRIREAF